MAARRQRLLRRLFVCVGIGRRRRDGLRCMTIELRDTEITALIRKGLLKEDVRSDLRAVKTAFYGFLDQTLDLNS